MDQLFKTGLRIWLTITTLIAFLTGWGLLAHSQKPVPLTSPSALLSSLVIPELAPVPSLEQLQQGPQVSLSIPKFNSSLPVLRTMGS